MKATHAVTAGLHDEEEADRAGRAVVDVIGERDAPWRVLVTTGDDPTRGSWTVEVIGSWQGHELLWRLVFVGDWMNAEAIGRQFALNLRPYPPD